MRRYLITVCGLMIFGAYLVAQGGGDQTSAPTEARLRETVANLRAGRIATPTDYDRLNAEQKTYWNEQAGPIWVSQQERLDRQIGPHGERAIARLAPAPGERVLDLGCGCGASSLELARSQSVRQSMSDPRQASQTPSPYRISGQVGSSNQQSGSSPRHGLHQPSAYHAAGHSGAAGMVTSPQLCVQSGLSGPSAHRSQLPSPYHAGSQ